jgi:hypothetical protein
MDNIYKVLFQRKLISDDQYQFLEAIQTKRIVSLYYELRLMLYLGILLFTGGVGYFAYQNMGEIGHVVSMALIGVSIVVGFHFISTHALPYSNSEVSVNQVYFDYILILVSLLIISLFAYVQVYFGLVELMINWTSYVSAGILFFMAYRYDNKALLSMGITAMAAALGISITPVDWVKGEWSATSDLYTVTLFFGIMLLIAEQLLYRAGIKRHFRFTFQNFGLILYFMGAVSAMFDSETGYLYAGLIMASAGFLSWYTWQKRGFLFFLYSNLAGYIAITYLLFKLIDLIQGDYRFFTYYFPFTCIAYIVLLVNRKSHFAHD